MANGGDSGEKGRGMTDGTDDDDDRARDDDTKEDGATSRDITEKAVHETQDEEGANNLPQITLTAQHAFPSGSLLVRHRIHDPAQHGQRYDRRTQGNDRRCAHPPTR